MRYERRVLALVVTLLCATLTAGTLRAADEVYVDEQGLGLRGYDPVAYFTVGKPVEGSSSWTADSDGVTYRFASRESRDMFLSDPNRYVPAFGGWCSYGVRVGKKFAADPEVWMIVEDVLYVQLDRGTQKVWMRDREENIRIANILWRDIRAEPVEILGH